MKSIFFLSSFFWLMLITCSSNNGVSSKKLIGEWQVLKFYCNGDDLTLKGQYLIGFEKNNSAWLNLLGNDTKDFILSDYKIHKKFDTLKISIFNCEDFRLNGDYNLYIDTIQDYEKQHIVNLILDSENVYISAIRLKNK